MTDSCHPLTSQWSKKL